MKKFMILGVIAAISCSAGAASWQPIAITKTGTKMYVDKDSILINVNNPDEILYKSRLESGSDQDGLKKGELLVAKETLNCATATKTLFSLVKYNPSGQISYKSTDDGNAISVVKIKPNSIYTDVMNYLCPLLPQKAIKPENSQQVTSLAPNSKNIWSFVTQDENVLVQVDDTTISSNSKNKLVAFTSKMTSKSNSSSYLGKGQYFIAKNMADCEKGTVARLYVSKHDKNGTQLSEERYSFSEITYRIANQNRISGAIQKYVCKSVK
ncbi:hypothetical protein ACQWTT_001295 [Acinetobacter baumannii]